MIDPKGGDALMISWLAAAVEFLGNFFFAEGQMW
jgi:hypothetical protein